jgi:hypothetical protein
LYTTFPISIEFDIYFLAKIKSSQNNVSREYHTYKLDNFYFVYSSLIIKNTDPYKRKKCVSCKRDISLNEKYFTYPLSLQQVCFSCAKNEIPKTIDILKNDLKKIEEEQTKEVQ